MPYFCHIHEGLYVSDPEEEGCQHATCLTFRDKDVPPVGVVMGVVPGATQDTRDYRFHKDFDKGMDKYYAARKNGLGPKATTVDAVEKAEKEVASHTRALKKLGGAGEQLKTAPGVER